MKKGMFALAVFFCAAFLPGCQKDNHQKENIYYGEKTDLGDGTIRSYVVLDKDKNPVSLGFNFTEEALKGLPTTDEMGNMMMLDLPAEGVVTGFDHIEVDWNPNGHEPLAIYGLPHFDFHFYVAGMDELMKIVPGPDMTPVAPEYIPKDYTSGIFAVPNMGVHWTDTLAAEYHGSTFDKTFIYGFYNGEMLFVEPMITVAFLQTHPNISTDVKLPQQFQKHAWYPTKYRVAYDAPNKEYFVSLEGLVKH